jgi:hypothetical protein
MIKQISLLKAKSGMARDTFIKRYEEIHAPLMLKLAPDLPGYRRNFLIPGSMVTLAHTGTAAAEPDFDVITEIWYKDLEQLKTLERAIADVSAGNRMSGEGFTTFDVPKTRVFMADEYVTSAKIVAPRPMGHQGPPEVTMMAMPRKIAGMSRDAFIDRYENGHAELGIKLLKRNGQYISASYRRSYPAPGSWLQLEAANDSVADEDIDVLTEISFWTKADYQAFQGLCGDPKNAAILTEDEKQLFDRSVMMMFLVEPRVSRLPVAV